METFVKHPEFQKLNIGFALDEGKELTVNASLNKNLSGSGHSDTYSLKPQLLNF